LKGDGFTVLVQGEERIRSVVGFRGYRRVGMLEGRRGVEVNVVPGGTFRRDRGPVKRGGRGEEVEVEEGEEHQQDDRPWNKSFGVSTE